MAMEIETEVWGVSRDGIQEAAVVTHVNVVFGDILKLCYTG